MEKRKLNYRKDRNQRQVKWVDTLEPKGKESDYTGSPYGIMSKSNVPGLQITPKIVILSINSELGKSHVLPNKKKRGRNFARNNNGTGDKGNGKKANGIL